MNNIVKLFLGIFLIALVSCEKEAELYQAINTKDAYNTVLDVDNGVTGAYYGLGSYSFLGRNVIAIGDLAADLAQADASTGHFVSINQYSFSEDDGNVNEMWFYGYKIIDRCVRAINGGNALLATANNDDDKLVLYSAISQAHAIRALTNFYMVNIFGLPYQPGNPNTQLGIVLVKDTPIEPFEDVSRSTVAETYALILDDIAKAKTNYTEFKNLGGDPLSAFYLGEAAIAALEARVNLYMGKNTVAAEAAQRAINLKGGTPVSNEIYQQIWSSLAISDEDIFTLAKSENDNLSANALNTLYGSYGASMTTFLKGQFEKGDIRLNLIRRFASADQPAKWQGISTAQAVSNIPIFRVSEMYLILAEAKAATDIPGAQEALFFTAKRDEGITAATDLPNNTEDLLTFIEAERMRELFAEGHRWYDLRRTGKTFLYASAVPFDLAKFVFPIPSAEVLSGFGVQQNEGWDNAIPKKN